MDIPLDIDSPQLQAADSSVPKRLRAACDSCHKAKIKCSGGQPCKKCQHSKLSCNYSYMARLGKPKGSRNKKTLERLSQLAAAATGGADVARQPQKLYSRGSGLNRTPSQDSHDDVFLARTALTATSWATPASTCPSLGGDDFNTYQDSGASGFQSFLDSGDMAMSPTASDPDLLPIHLINPPISKDGNLHGLADLGFPSGFGINGIDSDGESLAAEWRTFNAHAFDFGALLGQDYHGPSTPDQDGLTEPYLSASTPTRVHNSHRQGSSSLTKKSRTGRTSSSCTCQKILSDQLSRLRSIEERTTERTRLDTIMAEISAVLIRAEHALACAECWLDLQTIMLVMTLLQAVFTWAQADYGDRKSHRDPLAVRFGKWRVSHEDGHVVKAVLVGRVLAKSGSILEALRLRLEEMDLANDDQTSSSSSSSTSLSSSSISGSGSPRRILQRLVDSFGEVTQYVHLANE